MPDSLDKIQLRFVLISDPGATREGMGVDDIHIYDKRLYAGTNDIISISPNPTNDGNIAIEWAAKAGTSMSIAIADISGKNVFNYAVTATNEGYNRTVMKTPVFSGGMYLLRIVIGDKTHQHKIMYLRK